MGVKTGTKNWSEASQNDITKGDKMQMLSATDQARMGDENVGDMLNKIADPNWVDPNKKVRGVGNDKMDKDGFMKLMLAQMKHQDPSNPMQSHELAAQLAQFSSVEQLQNINTTLTDMKAGQKPTESFQALNFIGKAVSGDSAKYVRIKGDKDYDFSFNLPDNAKEAVVRIRNGQGETIRTVNMKDLKKGSNNFNWNGQDERGQVAPAGEYSFFVDATSAQGTKLAAKTDFEGKITGVNYTPEGPVLLVGNQSIKLKDVKKIVDPGLMNNGQIAKNVAGQDLKTQPLTTHNEEKKEDVKAADDPPLQTTSNLMDSVKMSRDMMSRLEKETKPDSSSKSSVK
jgi:flagellar basal-body rod modification protein FlgD